MPTDHGWTLTPVPLARSSSQQAFTLTGPPGVGSYADDPTNLLTIDQSTFENGLAGWFSPYAPGVELRLDPQYKHSGTVGMTPYRVGSGALIAQTPGGTAGFPISPNRLYQISLWVTARTFGSAASFGAGLLFYDASGNLLSEGVGALMDVYPVAEGAPTFYQSAAGNTGSGPNARYGALQVYGGNYDVGGSKVGFDDLFLHALAGDYTLTLYGLNWTPTVGGPPDYWWYYYPVSDTVAMPVGGGPTTLTVPAWSGVTQWVLVGRQPMTGYEAVLAVFPAAFPPPPTLSLTVSPSQSMGGTFHLLAQIGGSAAPYDTRYQWRITKADGTVVYTDLNSTNYAANFFAVDHGTYTATVSLTSNEWSTAQNPTATINFIVTQENPNLTGALRERNAHFAKWGQ